MSWAAHEYLDAAVRDVLTAGEPGVDDAVGHAALLLACLGAPGESDRLVGRWQAATERPATRLATGPVSARAWAMLFAARGARPGWADALVPLDLAAEERAHASYLARGVSPLPEGLPGGLPGHLLAELTEHTGAEPGPLRVLAAEAEDHARAGDRDSALAAIRRWAGRAERAPRPEVAMLAACRHVAPLLVEGVLREAFGVDPGWPEDCAGRLAAALHQRHPDVDVPADWAGLVRRILDLRESGAAPPPATPEGLAAAEARLGTRLPEDYREFLRTCDGLPAHEVFPRLLGAGELVRHERGHVVVSEPGEYGVIVLARVAPGWRVVEWDPALGSTVHDTFHALLTTHLHLLAESRE